MGGRVLSCVTWFLPLCFCGCSTDRRECNEHRRKSLNDTIEVIQFRVGSEVVKFNCLVNKKRKAKVYVYSKCKVFSCFVVLFSRVWIKQRGETTSTVFFIDFGNFETVSNDNIYELPEEFWKVRPTALPFRVLGLFGVCY